MLLLLGASLKATTLSVVPIFEPISLHGTDVDGALTNSDEALQATVVRRPMALSGAFPETLVEATRTPHRLATNDPQYDVEEVNLLELCAIGIAAEMTREGLVVVLDVSEAEIPREVDATLRQVMKLTALAVRRTLEVYQEPQPEALKVFLKIKGEGVVMDSLRDLEGHYLIEGS